MTEKTLFDSDLTLEEAEELIKNGADVNEFFDLEESTPLFFVLNADIAKLLIENGADVNAKNNYSETPIFYVEDLSIAKLLIDNEVDLNIKNDVNSTPLYSVNDIEITELLIKNGVDVNTKNSYGATVLDNIRESDHLTDEELITNAKTLIALGTIAGEVINYQGFRDLFSEEQQKAFDIYQSMTSHDDDFFQMCLAYQNDIKNNIKIEIKDMEIQ